jgi:hypothetical protein
LTNKAPGRWQHCTREEVEIEAVQCYDLRRTLPFDRSSQGRRTLLGLVHQHVLQTSGDAGEAFVVAESMTRGAFVGVVDLEGDRRVTDSRELSRPPGSIFADIDGCAYLIRCPHISSEKVGPMSPVMDKVTI